MAEVKGEEVGLAIAVSLPFLRERSFEGENRFGLANPRRDYITSSATILGAYVSAMNLFRFFD